MKAECRKRLKDLADAQEKPVAATPHHPNDTAAVVPLQCLLPGERHTSTFVIAMPCVNSETSCESSSEQAVRVASPGRNDTRDAHCCDSFKRNILNDGHVRRCKPFPRGFDQGATDDSTVAPVQLEGDRRSGAWERNHVLV